MFTLFMTKAKVVAVTVLSELRGKERVAACCVTFEMSSNNFILSEFDSQLRHALYSRDLDARLQPSLVEDDMDGLVCLKMPKWRWPLTTTRSTHTPRSGCAMKSPSNHQFG